MLLLIMAASVVTLNCTAHDIISGEQSGPPAEWTVTVDYAKKYAYAQGAPIYRSPTGVGDLEITPGQITFPDHQLTSTRRVETAMISRTSGAVVVQVHDLRKELEDIFARHGGAETGNEGRSRFVGVCKPGTLVPIPSAKF